MTALSIVIPCFNEQECLPTLHRRVTAAARAAVGDDYELVLVNDGSKDRTWAMMRELAASDPHLAAVNLSRNHGHQLALTAGLDLARGETILIIDADLQDPPELLGDMIETMRREGADVVYACAPSAPAKRGSSAPPRTLSIGCWRRRQRSKFRSMRAISD